MLLVFFIYDAGGAYELRFRKVGTFGNSFLFRMWVKVMLEHGALVTWTSRVGMGRSYLVVTNCGWLMKEVYNCEIKQY